MIHFMYLLPETKPSQILFQIELTENPEVFNVYFISEVGARILFETVRWVRSIEVIL